MSYRGLRIEGLKDGSGGAYMFRAKEDVARAKESSWRLVWLAATRRTHVGTMGTGSAHREGTVAKPTEDLNGDVNIVVVVAR
jgi:hypothetical protein